MTESKKAAAICPLCGSDNQCAVAAGQPAASCWCQTASISAEARAQAVDSAGERCLCPACGQPARDTPDER